MANTTVRLYIRCAAGYSIPPKKLIDLPPGQTYYLVWFEGARNPPHIAVFRESCSEGFSKCYIEFLRQLVDIGLNLSLAPSVRTPVPVNSLSIHLIHGLTRLPPIVKD
jgi:hypothetical protein